MTQQMTIPQALNLALQHQNAGNLEQAELIYRQVLQADPKNADALHLFGLLAFQAGQIESALELIRRAITVNPVAPVLYCSLSRVFGSSGRFNEAIVACKQALALRPAYPEALNNLGNALRALGRLDDAIAAYRNAVAAQADFADGYNNLGIALREKGELDDAIAAYRQALVHRSDFPEALNHLGVALLQKGEVDEAITITRQAIELKPQYAEAHSNLGKALNEKGDFEESLQTFRQAISMRPDFAVAHHNLGLSLLQQGDLRQGWLHHEWRLRAPELGNLNAGLPRSQWDGTKLDSRQILLHAEQGLGDAIQFARYVSLVAERGGRVILQCHPELARVFKSLQGVEAVIPRGQALPEFHFHCPLMSLPMIFDTTLETIPATVPYLHPDSELSPQWAKRLPSGTRKVGLVWSGRRRPDPNRSIPPDLLASLSQVQGVSFVSLQSRDEDGSDHSAPSGLKLMDWSDELRDFSDTAALINNLDLVISIDTAVAHLAGAMGKPVWVLLSSTADWRWLLNRNDSPWYPSMRLFRQSVRGNWEAPLQQVIEALRTL